MHRGTSSILADNPVRIGFFNGRSTREAARLDRDRGSERLIIGGLVLGEVLRGFRDAARARRADQLLSWCEPAIIGGETIARQAADHDRTLRALGHTPRKTIDLLIGTWCLHHNTRLLHNDRDFHPMTTHFGLREA